MADREIIDIVDKNNNVIGSADVKTAHDQKLMHRVVGVFVFDADDGELYLQTDNKYGKLDIAVGGHVQKSETYESAAQREMDEEIGLKTSIKHISTFLPENARLNHYWAIYEAIAPLEWKFKETEEVKALEKRNLQSVISMMKSDPDLFTHGFVNTIKEFMRIKNI
ncbi:MAG: NUDIX domain-containing protein [Bacteroidia bacterium]|jgi:isopentenyldiphosphate isomerase